MTTAIPYLAGYVTARTLAAAWYLLAGLRGGAR